MQIASRGSVPPFFVMELMRAANALERAGRSVQHMEVGQPSTPAPRKVLEAAERALRADRLGYTDALGVPELREAIAGWYAARYGVAVSPSRVCVTTGSSGAFQVGFLAAFEIGDRVAMASPSYPAYRHTLTAIGAVPVELETGPETGFQPTPEMLDRLDRPVKGLIVAGPANPTGSMPARAEFMRLSDWCRANDVRLVSDEIYHGLTYGKEETTAAALNDDALVINSFSKYFSMTGWRLGWMIAPADLVRPIESLTQNLFISAPTLSQLAAVAAFDCVDELEGHVARYGRNRDLLLRELPAAGFDRIAPADGAFYLYADVSHLTDDSEAFCHRMLHEAGVAATPGIDFDPRRGRGFVRFAYARDEEHIARAVEKLAAWKR